MNLSKALANRLREVILDGTWIANTNYKNELEAIDVATANFKIEGFNTIAILCQHIHYYIAGVLQYLVTDKLTISDKHSFEFTPFRTEDAWEEVRNKLYLDTEKLASHIEHLTNERLKAHFSDPKYGNHLRNIDGLIEHCYYHLGQILLIRKMIATNKTSNQL